MDESEENGSSSSGDENRSIVENGPIEVFVDLPCIACAERKVVNTLTPLSLPFIGKALQTSFICTSCGFKHSDIIILENRGPRRFELLVDSPAALNSRIVRSNSGTIRIPEIGLGIEPGTASESFVSNVEGVLDRVSEVVMIVRRDAELDIFEKCESLLGKISRMKEGNEPFHLVIEDPYGNSAIIGSGVTVTVLDEEEAHLLPTGETTFNIRSGSSDDCM
jgi:zinc finger protein